MHYVKTILLKSWLWAIPLSVVVVMFLPDMFKTYEIKPVNQGRLKQTSENQLVFLHDLNHDGESEMIYSYLFHNKHSVIVFSAGGQIDQWNFDGYLLDLGRMGFGDINNDGNDEIFVFTRTEDAIYLHCIDPLNSSYTEVFRNKKICDLSNKYDEPDPELPFVSFMDIDNDGFGDLIYFINTGRSKFPRNLFVYNHKKDLIKKNDTIGSSISESICISDLDCDSYLEIICTSRATGQVSDSLDYDYHDYSAWLIVYNHNLKILFPPIENTGFNSKILASQITRNDTPLIATFSDHNGSKKNIPELKLINSMGKIISILQFHESEKISRFFFANREKQEMYIYSDAGNVKIFDYNFELVDSFSLMQPVGDMLFNTDLNKDGNIEYIFARPGGGVIITQNDFSHPILFHSKSFSYSKLQIQQNGADPPYLFFYNDTHYLTCGYGKNPYAPFEYAIYLGIFLAIWLFIEGIRKTQRVQSEKNERIRRQLVDLQLKNFGNQMDPHFTFNVFNTMAHRIKQDSPSTFDVFMRFTKLIRNVLESSDKITRSINEELDYLRNYLELEKSRFPNKFEYNIEIDEGISHNMIIPKMLLQTYVENSIKHGIRHKTGIGKLEILISSNNKHLEFIVRDDGIGRRKAKEVSKGSTGLGLQIMQNYFDLFNDYNSSKITHEITDLYDNLQNSAGTEVKVLIPKNFSFKIKKHEKR